MPGKVNFIVIDHGVAAMLWSVPKTANYYLNQALAKVGRSFAYHFTAQRLGGPPGITIRKRGRVGRGRSHFRIPAQMKKAGFRGYLLGKTRIHAKAVVIATRSPVMWAHEYGAVITPKTARYLALKVRRREEARRLGKKVGSRIYVRRVVLPARLGFYDTWAAFVPTAYQIVWEAIWKLTALYRQSVVR